MKRQHSSADSFNTAVGSPADNLKIDCATVRDRRHRITRKMPTSIFAVPGKQFVLAEQALPCYDSGSTHAPLKETVFPTEAASTASALQPLPTLAADGQRVRWRYLIGVVTIHFLALFALLPSLFSWTSVVVALAGLYVFGTLGINICYHRLLAHRSFRCSATFEHLLALLGVCCLQDTPLHWVAAHRLHHQHSDDETDPHSPVVGFFWSHVGWLWVENGNLQFAMYGRYIKDLLRDRFYLRLERDRSWLLVHLAQWCLFFFGGAAIGWFSTGQLSDSVRMGFSMLVWGVFVRTVLVWHITWSVNSVTHLWGYRNYTTNDGSRNNWLIGLISNGEGWHNNHHAQPQAAAHGHRWWELDVSFLTLQVLGIFGLVWEVVLPKPESKIVTAKC